MLPTADTLTVAAAEPSELAEAPSPGEAEAWEEALPELLACPEAEAVKGALTELLACPEAEVLGATELLPEAAGL